MVIKVTNLSIEGRTAKYIAGTNIIVFHVTHIALLQESSWSFADGIEEIWRTNK